MLWTFTRERESIKIETRFDNETKEYVLIFYRDDGGPQIERFADAFVLRDKLAALEEELEAQRWRFNGVVVLRDGWKI